MASARHSTLRANRLFPGGPVGLAGLFLALVPSAPLRAQESAATAPSLRAGRLSSPLKLDGRLDEAAWLSADSIASLTQVTPVEGGPAASRTVIKVLASDRAIVFGIVAYGAPGVSITSFTKARDTDPANEDYLRLVLDTFRDGRSGYVFSINPTGARLDGLVVRQGEGTDASWDAIWEAVTARDGNTWSVEIRIPVVSLIFRPDLTAWGFNVQRQVKATQEVTRWASPAQNIQPTQTSRAGLLTDLPRFTLGLGLSVRPSLVAGGGYPAPDTSLQGTLRPSLDITQRIGSNIVGSLTANMTAWNRWCASVVSDGRGRVHPVAHLTLRDTTWLDRS